MLELDMVYPLHAQLAGGKARMFTISIVVRNL